jgi:hypothetical protein
MASFGKLAAGSSGLYDQAFICCTCCCCYICCICCCICCIWAARCVFVGAVYGVPATDRVSTNARHWWRRTTSPAVAVPSLSCANPTWGERFRAADHRCEGSGAVHGGSMRLRLSLATDGGGGSPSRCMLWRGDDAHGGAVITRGSAVFRAAGDRGYGDQVTRWALGKCYVRIDGA